MNVWQKCAEVGALAHSMSGIWTSHITFRCVISIASSCLPNDGKYVEPFRSSVIQRASIQIIWNIIQSGNENIFRFSVLIIHPSPLIELKKRQLFLAIFSFNILRHGIHCWGRKITCNPECSRSLVYPSSFCRHLLFISSEMEKAKKNTNHYNWKHMKT